MFSRNHLVKIYEELQEYDSMKDLDTPLSVFVDFARVADAHCFGWVGEVDDEFYEMELSSTQINSARDLYETIAHEMIHLHFLRQGNEDWCEHTPEFGDIERRVFKEIETKEKW